MWQAGPQGAASAGAGVQTAAAYLLGGCQLGSTHASVRLSLCNVKALGLEAGAQRVKKHFIKHKTEPDNLF